MSLIENTTNLEEVLQKVRALPTASGSGGGSLNKVLLGELNLNSSNLIVGTQPNSYNFGSNEQAIMSNILSKASSGNDIIAVEFYETSMGVNQIQIASFFKMNTGIKGVGIDDVNGSIWLYENYVYASDMYLSFLSSAMNGNGSFNFKFYSLVGGSSSTTSGSLNKVLLGEFELNSTNLTDEESSSAPYHFSLGADVQAVMSSVFSKASLGNDVIVVELSGSTYRQIYICDFNCTTETEYTHIYAISIGMSFYRDDISCDQNMAMWLSMTASGTYEPISVKFYALAGGSTGSDADLVIRVNNTFPYEPISDTTNIVIEKGDLQTIAQSIGQKPLKCEVHYATYDVDNNTGVSAVIPAILFDYGGDIGVTYVSSQGIIFSAQIVFNVQTGNAVYTSIGYSNVTPIE